MESILKTLMVTICCHCVIFPAHYFEFCHVQSAFFDGRVLVSKLVELSLNEKVAECDRKTCNNPSANCKRHGNIEIFQLIAIVDCAH